MKLAYKIALIAVIICIGLSWAFAFNDGGGLFLMILGAIVTVVSFLIFFVGLFLQQPYQKAFWLASGILLLLGMGICGPMLLGLYPGM